MNGAREKLNSIYAGFALIVAAMIGAASGSWIVFILSSIVLVGLAMNSGDIRPKRRRR